MYSVGVRDHFMIAHSFQGAAFGPAQALHGATYVVDLELFSDSLDQVGVVVDIAAAREVLGKVLAEFNFRNLDELPEFQGHNTTTEFMARALFLRIAGRVRRGELGPSGARIQRMRVRLGESHVAWASYEDILPESDG